MRKFYILLALVVFSGYIFGQSINMDSKQLTAPKKLNATYNNRIEYKKISVGNYQTSSNSHLKSGNDSITYLYDYTGAWEDSTGISGLDNLTNVELFPDTLVKIHYLNGDFGITNYPAIGVSVDPGAPIYKNNRINIGKNYILDSIYLPAWYFRNNTTVSEINNADTLLVDVIQQYPYYFYFPDDTIKKTYGDTVFFLPIYFENNYLYNASQKRFDSIGKVVYGKNKFTPVTINRYKILLTPQTISDTFTAGYHGVAFRGLSLLSIATHDLIKGGPFTVGIHFKPGYTYVEGDLFSQKNSIQVFSYEEHDTTNNSSHPNNGGSWPSYNRKDFNSSYIIPYWWDESFKNHTTPSIEYTSEFAWTSKAFALENHWILFKMRGIKDTSKLGGISENEVKTIKILQNYPNPADKYTNINYELTQPDNIILIVTDLTGNKVMEINKGNQMPGNYNLRLNTSSLSSGMYFYTIKVNNSSITQKLIISR